MKGNKLVLFFLCFSCFFIKAHAFEDPSVDAKALYKLWYKNFPKKGARYYDFDLNGLHFKGSRPWQERWDLISNATSFENKKVLELGSNVGICSIFIAKYLPVSSVVAVDHERSFTRLCSRMQDVFEVEFPVYCLDLDHDSFEKTLGYDYDIVICMSLYNWVKDKTRLLKYLSHFSQVIYEGHDSKEIEVRRLEKAGFKYHKLLGYGKEIRPVLLFSKEPIDP
jgi:SAM-dependent methyltransferase